MLNGRFDFFMVSDVSGNRRCRAPRRYDHRGSSFGACLVDVGDDHRGAFPREGRCCSAANATRSAEHDYRLSAESHRCIGDAAPSENP